MAVHDLSASRRIAIRAFQAIQRSCTSPPPASAASPDRHPLRAIAHRARLTRPSSSTHCAGTYTESSKARKRRRRRKRGALQRDREELRDAAEDHDDRNREVDDPTRASATVSAIHQHHQLPSPPIQSLAVISVTEKGQHTSCPRNPSCLIGTMRVESNQGVGRETRWMQRRAGDLSIKVDRGCLFVGE